MTYRDMRSPEQLPLRLSHHIGQAVLAGPSNRTDIWRPGSLETPVSAERFSSMTFLRFTTVASAAIALSYLPGALSTAPQAFAQTGTAQAAPDNSTQNKNHAETADDQTNSKSDRVTTQKIRKAIMADKSLSTYAHNVKIITVDGAVTLKGPVQSEDEKQKIASEAASVVSTDKITNELTVKQ
jgi:hyperosmotically inducible periplasmic protein